MQYKENSQPVFTTLARYGNDFKRWIRTSTHQGVTFYDMDPLLANPDTLEHATLTMANRARASRPTIVLGMESRGYALAPLLARHLGIGWKMMRKAGKTPDDVFSLSYGAEYGPPRTMELGKSSLDLSDRVLLVDDVLATGGTACAAEKLVEMAGAKVAFQCFLIQLDAVLTTPPVAPFYSLMHMSRNEITPFCAFHPNVLDRTNSKIQKITTENCLEWDLDKRIVLLAYPTMQSMAMTLARTYPDLFVIQSVEWNHFPDGFPNITFPGNLVNRHVAFLGSLRDPGSITNQLSLSLVLPRQGVASLSVVYPWYGPGTHERVDTEGQLATAETLAKLMSSTMPLTKSGPATVCIYDIHALQERFYFDDGIRPSMCSAIPTLLQHLAGQEDDLVIVFPDDGAVKRFGKAFGAFSQIVCSKVRCGDARTVTLKDRMMKKDSSSSASSGGNKKWTRALIVDDLVQTGGTLYECMRVLKADGFTTVSAYVTHAIFPHQAYLDFLPGGPKEGFHRFYVTDSVPEVSSILPAPFFQIISLVPDLARQLCMQACLPPLLLQPSLSPTDSLHLLVASRQPVKIAAVEEAANRIWKLASRVVEASPETLFTEPPSTIAPIKSGKKNKSAIDSTKSTTNTSRKLNIVNPQPVGREETFRGCMDRFLKQKAQCDKRVGEGDVILVSVENGIILDNGDGQITPSRAFDQACILVERITLPCSQKETESEQNGTKAVTSPCKKGPVCVWSDAVEFPFSFYEKSRESGFQKTAGSFLAPTSSNDWHASYGEGKSRRQLLTDAITRAFLLLQ